MMRRPQCRIVSNRNADPAGHDLPLRMPGAVPSLRQCYQPGGHHRMPAGWAEGGSRKRTVASARFAGRLRRSSPVGPLCPDRPTGPDAGGRSRASARAHPTRDGAGTRQAHGRHIALSRASHALRRRRIHGPFPNDPVADLGSGAAVKTDENSIL